MRLAPFNGKEAGKCVKREDDKTGKKSARIAIFQFSPFIQRFLTRFSVMETNKTLDLTLKCLNRVFFGEGTQRKIERTEENLRELQQILHCFSNKFSARVYCSDLKMKFNW